MNEVKFSAWLQASGTSKKLCSDYLSRLKRIGRSISGCDIEVGYTRDCCRYLLSLFKNMGQNPEMTKKNERKLTDREKHIAAFSYAVRKYVQFRTESPVSITVK